MNDEYGTITVSVDYDHDKPVVTVLGADPTVGISCEVLAKGQYWEAAPFTDDGCLVIGDVNTVTLKPIRFADGGRTIVCERVD